MSLDSYEKRQGIPKSIESEKFIKKINMSLGFSETCSNYSDYNYTIISKKIDSEKQLVINCTTKLTKTSPSTSLRFDKKFVQLSASAKKYFEYKIRILTGCNISTHCQVTLKINGTSNFIGRNYVLGSGKEINFKFSVVNSGEPAFDANVTIVIPKESTFSKVPSNCKEQSNNWIMICELNNGLAFKKESGVDELSFPIKIDTKTFDGNATQVFAYVTSAGVPTAESEQNKTIEIQLSRESNITVVG